MDIANIKTYFLENFKGEFTFDEITIFINKCNYYKIIEYFNIKLTILYDKKSAFNASFFNEIIKRLYKIANKPLNYYILLSPFKRYLPDKHNIIRPININGGYTYINGNNIYVYRLEELPKVLLHETIHHLIDVKWKDNNLIKLKEAFNIDEKTVLYPNEAVIELFATILQLYFVSNYNCNKLKKLIKEEINYSRYKCYQILNLLNKKWYEKTNSYCYIIFKTILLINFKKYMSQEKYIFNDDYITDFLIQNKKIYTINKNPTKKRKDNSLCMMVNSDY